MMNMALPQSYLPNCTLPSPHTFLLTWCGTMHHVYAHSPSQCRRGHSTLLIPIRRPDKPHSAGMPQAPVCTSACRTLVTWPSQSRVRSASANIKVMCCCNPIPDGLLSLHAAELTADGDGSKMPNTYPTARKFRHASAHTFGSSSHSPDAITVRLTWR